MDLPRELVEPLGQFVGSSRRGWPCRARTPSHSMAASTSTSGISVSRNSGSSGAAGKLLAEDLVQLPGDVGILGRVLAAAGGLDLVEA